MIEWWENQLPATVYRICWQVFPPLHHVLTFLPIAQPAFEQFRWYFKTDSNLSFIYSTAISLTSFVMVIKQKLQEQVIEVVILTKQVQKDAGQMMGPCKFKNYYPLVTAIYLSVCLSVRFKILVNVICEISKVFILIEYISMCVHFCVPVCDIQSHFVICIVGYGS